MQTIHMKFKFNTFFFFFILYLVTHMNVNYKRKLLKRFLTINYYARSGRLFQISSIISIFKGYGDLVASVQRLQLQLKKAGTGGGLGGLEGRVAAVQSLLLSPQFGRALAIHNKVQSVRSKISIRPATSAQTALRDCLDALGNSQSAYVVELATLLSGK